MTIIGNWQAGKPSNSSLQRAIIHRTETSCADYALLILCPHHAGSNPLSIPTTTTTIVKHKQKQIRLTRSAHYGTNTEHRREGS